MQRYQGQYSGAALSAFIKGLGRSPRLIERILSSYGLREIALEEWYDLELARAIYYDVERRIGSRALYNVGVQMIESAPFPPEIDDVPTVLSSLNAAYLMNVRGPQIGEIRTSIDSEQSALITYSTPFPCHLEQGVTIGCCKKFGALALLEHQSTECRDRGASSCQYRVSW